jgi:hypothetical protein
MTKNPQTTGTFRHQPSSGKRTEPIRKPTLYPLSYGGKTWPKALSAWPDRSTSSYFPSSRGPLAAQWRVAAETALDKEAMSRAAARGDQPEVPGNARLEAEGGSRCFTHGSLVAAERSDRGCARGQSQVGTGRSIGRPPMAIPEVRIATDVPVQIPSSHSHSALRVLLAGLASATVLWSGPSSCAEPTMAICRRIGGIASCVPGPCEVARHEAHVQALCALAGAIVVSVGLVWAARIRSPARCSVEVTLHPASSPPDPRNRQSGT